MDESNREIEDNDPRYGVSDGVSFVGFATVDKPTYARGLAPCFGVEGASGNSFTASREIKRSSPRPNDFFYPDCFLITLKFNEHCGSCYTVNGGGFVKTAAFNMRLLLNKGLDLEVFKHNKTKEFIEVTVI